MINRKKTITPDDLLDLRLIVNPQMSPTGENILFVVRSIDRERNSYLSHLWLHDLETNRSDLLDTVPISSQLTRWSPDGNRIVFLANQNGKNHICIMEIGSGKVATLAEIDEGFIDSLTWDPSGEYISFTFRPIHPDFTREAQSLREKKNLTAPPRVIRNLKYKSEGEGFIDDRNHLWRCCVTDGLIEQITFGDYDVESHVWSPDSKWIAFIANQHPNQVNEPYHQDLWVIPAGGGVPEMHELPNGYRSDLCWTEDGEYIAYVGSHTQVDPWSFRTDCLWLVPANGGSPLNLTTSLERPLENLIISDSCLTGQRMVCSQNGKFYFLISDQGNSHLYTAAANKNASCLIEGDLDISAVSCDKAGESLVILCSTPTQPGELFLSDGKSGKLQQITQFNTDWTQRVNLIRPEPFQFPGEDGIQIDGWLMTPPGLEPEKKYPLVLAVHGGPDMMYGNTFMYEFQLLAAQGYHVLYTNPRGSAGYGEAFANSIKGNWGSQDFDDLMAAVDWSEELPSVDADKMAIMGGSYGGFLVSWAVSQTDRFCCAIAERGAYNRHSAVGTSDFPPLPDGYWPGNAWNQPERLWEQSPLRGADRIFTPLLLIQGEGDLRCPVEQAEQFFTALKRLDRDVTFVRYPVQANHSFSRTGPPDLRLDRLNRILVWLREYFQQPVSSLNEEK